MSSAILFILVASALTGAILSQEAPTFGPLNTPEILEYAGYIVKKHYITTTDGYIFRLIQVGNPKVNGFEGIADKEPVLFIHGILTSSFAFVFNIGDTKAQNLSDVNVNQLSVDELIEKYGPQNSKSLPTIMLDLGYPVWLVDRRTCDPSLSARGKSPLDGIVPDIIDPFTILPIDTPKFWNFSFDEQAAYDVPECIDYILQQSQRPKLSLVGHSAGGLLILMSLSLYPELANKIVKAELWAPAFDIGHSGDQDNYLQPLLPLLVAYKGPVPPSYFINAMQSLSTYFCNLPLASSLFCDMIGDSMQGSSDHQVSMTPQAMNSIVPASSHEYAQLAQTTKTGRLHKFEYSSSAQNNIAYGQPKPPAYNVSAVILETMEFWAGNTDTLVSPADVFFTVSNLRVPYKIHLINEPSISFNHMGFLNHRDVASLLYFPVLKYFEKRLLS